MRELWTDDERRQARKLGIPTSDPTWWWRARHVLNSDEREVLEALTTWLAARYAPERRRAALRVA